MKKIFKQTPKKEVENINAKYYATISCTVNGCGWKLIHDTNIDGSPDWNTYAEILRNHNILRHSNFELIDNMEKLKHD